MDELYEALETIAGGYTQRFPGAPDPFQASSPEAFQSAMWLWSQKVAKAALANRPKDSVVVPREPTAAMLDAGYAAWRDACSSPELACWNAMLAAAQDSAKKERA